MNVLNGDLGTLRESPEAGLRSLAVLAPVVADLQAGGSSTQYRFFSEPVNVGGGASFAGVTGGQNDPKLVIMYRDR